MDMVTKVNISELADRAYREASGSHVKAINIFDALLKKFRAETALLQLAKEQQIDDAMLRYRAAVIRASVSGNCNSVSNPDNPKGLFMHHSWLAYPLAGGLPLGEADADKLRKEISRHSALSKTHGIRTKWFTLLLKKLDKGKKVRECLNDQEINDLYTRCEREA